MTYHGTGRIVKKHRGSALYYQLKENLPTGVICDLFAANGESREEIMAHSQSERHWLADWGFQSMDLFDALEDGGEAEVEFTVKSTTYKDNMWHNGVPIGPCRNLNIASIHRR